MVIVAEVPIHVFKLENVYEINPNSHYIIVSMTLLIYLLHFFIITNVEQRNKGMVIRSAVNARTYTCVNLYINF